MVTDSQIRKIIRINGLAGKPVCIHSSMRSFGETRLDPRVIIDAILSEGCTIMVPTATYIEFGGCSGGFPNLEDPLKELKSEAMVGESLWHIFPAQQLAQTAANIIKEIPEITRCDREDCDRCIDAIKGGPIFDTQSK